MGARITFTETTFLMRGTFLIRLNRGFPPSSTTSLEPKPAACLRKARTCTRSIGDCESINPSRGRPQYRIRYGSQVIFHRCENPFSTLKRNLPLTEIEFRRIGLTRRVWRWRAFFPRRTFQDQRCRTIVRWASSKQRRTHLDFGSTTGSIHQTKHSLNTSSIVTRRTTPSTF